MSTSRLSGQVCSHSSSTFRAAFTSVAQPCAMKVENFSWRRHRTQFLLWSACGAVSIPYAFGDWPLLAVSLVAVPVLASLLALVTSGASCLSASDSLFQRSFRAAILIRLGLGLASIGKSGWPPLCGLWVETLQPLWGWIRGYPRAWGGLAVYCFALSSYTAALIGLCMLLIDARGRTKRTGP